MTTPLLLSGSGGTTLPRTLLLAAGAAAAISAYLAGTRRLSARSAPSTWSWTGWRWRRYAFGAGAASVVISLLPAVDARADDSLVWHMVQHLVLMWISAPLLALAVPGLAVLLALPRPWRRRVARVRAWRPVRTTVAWVMQPVVVAALDAAVVVGWHLPAPYAAALQSDLLHAAEHGSFLLGAWLMWSPLAGLRPRLTGGMAVLYVFVTGFPSVGVGAGLVVATHPLYPAQTGTGPAALAAQQTAGVLMWIPPTFLSLLLCAVLVLAWFRGMERAAPGDAPLPSPVPPALPAARASAAVMEVPR